MKLSNPIRNRRELFAKEFVKDMNPTHAARRVGYSPHSARRKGWDLMQEPEVQVLIQKEMDARAKRCEIEADNVLKEIAKTAFSNIDDFLVIHEDGSAHIDLSKAGRSERSAISKYIVDEWVEGEGEKAKPVRRTRLEMRDKTANLELLGKHLGLFKEKPEVEINITNIYAEVDAYLESISEREVDELIARLERSTKELPPAPEGS